MACWSLRLDEVDHPGNGDFRFRKQDDRPNVTLPGKFEGIDGAFVGIEPSDRLAAMGDKDVP